MSKTFLINLRVFTLIIGVGVVVLTFLFIFSQQVHAAKGYGWIVDTGRGPIGSNACGGISNADIIFHLAKVPFGHSHKTGDIKVTSRSTGDTSTGNNTSHVTRNCYNPATGLWYEVDDMSGYRDAVGGVIKKNPAAFVNRDNHWTFWASPNSALPTIQTTAPASGIWFTTTPNSFTVKNRMLPGSNSTKIIQFLFEIVCQTPTFCGSFNGAGVWFGVKNGNFSATKNSMTTRTFNPNSFTPARPSFMPSGKYKWSAFHLENHSGSGPASAFSGREAFGIDRIDPVSISVSYAIQGLTCPDPTLPVEDIDRVVFCGRAQDGLSGLNRIEVFAKTGSPPSTSGPSNRVANCPYSNPVNVIKTCPSNLRGPWAAGTVVWYNTCARDRVGNRNCAAPLNFTVTPSVKPWLRTTKGNVGVFGSIIGFSFIQQRTYGAPNPIPGVNNYTSEYLMFTKKSSTNEKVRYGWLVENYLINMEKFPQPSGNSIYDTLFQKYSRRCLRDFSSTLTPGNIKTIVDEGCNVLRYTPAGVAVLAGSWAVTTYTGKPVIIFFPNSANVAGEPTSIKINFGVKIGKKTGIIFVTRKDIRLKRISPVSRVDGFYITDRRFVTDPSGTSTPPDVKLTINGSVISFFGGGINWRRDGYGRSLSSNDNKTIPAERINFQPKYLWLFADTLGDSRTIFRELPP